MKLIYEQSQEGRRASSLPRVALPIPEVPAELRRERPPRLPEIAEPEVVRHCAPLGADVRRRHRLLPARLVHDEAQPRVNERVVNLPGFATCIRSRKKRGRRERSSSCGASRRSWPRSRAPAVSLQPAAGSQGELTGLLLMRAYFADRGEAEARQQDRSPTPRTARTRRA